MKGNPTVSGLADPIDYLTHTSTPMKKTLILLVIFAFAVPGRSEDLPGVPATTNIPGQNYPRILPNLRVVRLTGPRSNTRISSP